MVCHLANEYCTKKIRKNNPSKQRCKTQMSTKIAKIAKNTKVKLSSSGKNNELQILNKQHIQTEGINVIASPHSKPQIYSTEPRPRHIAPRPRHRGFCPR